MWEERVITRIENLAGSAMLCDETCNLQSLQHWMDIF